jgi:hypothetical protein
MKRVEDQSSGAGAKLRVTGSRFVTQIKESRIMALAARRRTLLVLPVVGALIAALALNADPKSATAVTTNMQYGVNVYVYDNCTLPGSNWKTLAVNEMTGIKSLGANSVAIAFPFYTRSPTSNAVFARDTCDLNPVSPVSVQSPPPASLAVLVHEAKIRGLKVFLRPLMDEANLYVIKQWRGLLAPTDQTAWFTSYKAMLRPYLQMAKSMGVERFAISTELNSLRTSTQWSSFVTWAKTLYAGQLVYSTTWSGGNTSGISGAAFGVDTYPGISKATPAWTATQLLAAWNALLPAHPIPSGSGIHEVGISAVNGAYATPWIYAYPGGVFNATIQQRWFTAACQFAKSHSMVGIYFWGPNFAYNSGKLMTANDPNFPAQLQPATQTAIKNCFAS